MSLFSATKLLISATFPEKYIHHKQPLAVGVQENKVKTKQTKTNQHALALIFLA